jgi:hypothetical protein
LQYWLDVKSSDRSKKEINEWDKWLQNNDIDIINNSPNPKPKAKRRKIGDLINVKKIQADEFSRNFSFLFENN